MTTKYDTMSRLRYDSDNGRGFFLTPFTITFSALKRRLLPCGFASADSCLSNRIKVTAGAFALGPKIAKDRPAGTRTALLTNTIGEPTVSAFDSLPHTPDSWQDSLSIQTKQRVRATAHNPAALAALLFELCPGLTAAMALGWLEADLAFKAEAVEQAARLMGGEWEA